jgi:SAM-dependent methyltransferase
VEFSSADAYERFMGRWSELLAPKIVKFAAVTEGDAILDVGSGTGSLSRAVLNSSTTSRIVGIDPSAAYVEYGRARLHDPRLRFEVGNAEEIPFADSSFDKCLSQLVINFVGDAHKATSEMYRVTRPSGTVAAAVWDYGDGMEMLRMFWDAAVGTDPEADLLDERHMPYCRSGELASLWIEAGFRNIEEAGLEVPLSFTSFDDFWSPFLGGQGPAGKYVSGLNIERREQLRKELMKLLLAGDVDRPFELRGRAWAVRGIRP